MGMRELLVASRSAMAESDFPELDGLWQPECGREAAMKRRYWQVNGEVARLQAIEDAKLCAAAATQLAYSAAAGAFEALEPLRELLNLVEAKERAEKKVQELLQQLSDELEQRRKVELHAKLLRVDLSTETGRRNAAERSLGMQAQSYKTIVAKRERALEKLKSAVTLAGMDVHNPSKKSRHKRATYVDPDDGLNPNQKRRKQSAQWKRLKSGRKAAMVKMKEDVESAEKGAALGVDIAPKPEPKKRNGPEFRLLIRHEIQRGQENTRPPSPEERTLPW